MALWSERRPDDDFYRVLAPDGTVVGDPPELDVDTLRRFYRSFVETRRLEEKLLRMQRRGEISIIARSLGEEAVALGSAAALEPGDWCFPTYRQTAARAYWGSPVDRSVASLMGAETETVNEHLPPDEDEESVVFTPSYVPLTVNVTNAVGSAMVDRFQGTDTVSLAYVGDGSTSEGDFHEALNFAGVYEAPVVTVCQNNQWAISVPAHRQTAAETFAQKADAHGVPHERVDGNDVLAMYEATRQAVERARDGGGPAFIEAVTYRRIEHNTADEPTVYRDEEEVEYWAERDPLDRFDAYLRAEDVIDDAWVDAVEAEVDDAIDEGIARARDVPESDPERMFDNHLHGEPPWNERHQRAELRAEQRGENPFTDFDGSGL